MTDFDRGALTGRLARLPGDLRLLFAAMAAERLLPTAQAFLRARDASDAEQLRRALDVLWRRGGGEPVDASASDAGLASCEALVDAAAEEDSEESLLAENAAAVVLFGLRSLRSKDPEELGWAAQRAYDTVDHVATADEPDLEAFRDNARILAHPVVQQELRWQLDDVRALEELATKARIAPEDVQALRDEARRQARSVLSPDHG